MDNRPIGIFDSGYGGLTVLQEVRKILPRESLVYFGDSRNVPYSQFSEEECVRKALLCADTLGKKGAKALVVACNLMSGLALPQLREHFAGPVVGVIEAGAVEVRQVCRKIGARVGVIGSPALMEKGVYAAAIHALRPDIVVRSVGTFTLSTLVETGKIDSREADDAVAGYLREFDGFALDGLVLGCTHYPLLASSIQKALVPGVPLIDPAYNTAVHIKNELEAAALCCSPENPPAITYYTSGDCEEFHRFLQSVFRVEHPRVENAFI